jgi:hypothetical protein
MSPSRTIFGALLIAQPSSGFAADEHCKGLFSNGNCGGRTVKLSAYVLLTAEPESIEQT